MKLRTLAVLVICICMVTPVVAEEVKVPEASMSIPESEVMILEISPAGEILYRGKKQPKDFLKTVILEWEANKETAVWNALKQLATKQQAIEKAVVNLNNIVNTFHKSDIEKLNKKNRR